VAILTTAHFSLEEQYFQGAHVSDEPGFTTETSEIEASILSALISHGLDAQTVAMHVLQIDTAAQQTIHWRVDVTYLGDPITLDSTFAVSVGQAVTSLADPAHSNSVWLPEQGLVTVSHIPAP